nr:f-box/lrr-repeat protein 4 [Quercus suber]
MAACCDQSMSSFKVLKIQCIDVTDEALESIGTCCLSLELLVLYNLQRFTDRGLGGIGNGCKKLKNLCLSDCYFLSDKGLEAIATGCKELTHLKALKLSASLRYLALEPLKRLARPPRRVPALPLTTMGCDMSSLLS